MGRQRRILNRVDAQVDSSHFQAQLVMCLVRRSILYFLIWSGRVISIKISSMALEFNLTHLDACHKMSQILAPLI